MAQRYNFVTRYVHFRMIVNQIGLGRINWEKMEIKREVFKPSINSKIKESFLI